MTFNEAELVQIEQLAGLCFLPHQIAVILQVPVTDFIIIFNDKDSNVYLSYMKGSLEYESNVRKSIYDLAKGGSGPSQAEYLKLRRERDMHNFKLDE